MIFLMLIDRFARVLLYQQSLSKTWQMNPQNTMPNAMTVNTYVQSRTSSKTKLIVVSVPPHIVH